MIEDQIALFFSYILLYIHQLNQLPWIRLVVWLESFCFRLLGFVGCDSVDAAECCCNKKPPPCGEGFAIQLI